MMRLLRSAIQQKPITVQLGPSDEVGLEMLNRVLP